jgi:tetratricopeptide (TPR) repeat protein
MALHSRDYDQAISLYQVALRANPDNTRAASLLGQAYYRKGLNQEAVATLTPLMARSSPDPDAPIFLGLAWLAQGEREKGFAAMEQFQSAINRERRNVLTEVARFRGMEALNLEDVERALYQAIEDGFIEQRQVESPDD